MKHKRRWILFILFLAAGFFLLKTIMVTRIDPLVSELARAEVADLASDLITQAINDQISSGNVQYQAMVTLERDYSGNITALTANMQEMNRLKTQLLSTLDASAQSLAREKISVPLGNITGIQLLSGRGPDIPIKIIAISSSDAVFRGEFEDAGINQTIHRIMMDVSLELVILLPNGTESERVTTDVCVAETVLLGDVPGSYTYFNGAGSPAVALPAD